MIQTEEQVINVGAELDSLEVIIQRNVDAQMMANGAALLGPATLSSAAPSLQNTAALTPTLLGTIAEGIALSSLDSSAASAMLHIDFNCLEKADDNKVRVEVPVTGGDPIHFTFNK